MSAEQAEQRVTAYYQGRAHPFAGMAAEEFLTYWVTDAATAPDGGPPLLLAIEGGGESTGDRALLAALPDEQDGAR